MEAPLTISALSAYGAMCGKLFCVSFRTCLAIWKLDSLNELHFAALHYVYLPRINHALEEFARQHPLRTEHNVTLFTTSLQSTEPAAVDSNIYGVDEDGPVPDIQDPHNAVIVDPPTSNNVLLALSDPLLVDGNYTAHTY